MHAVGSGQQSSPLLVAVSRCFALVRRSRAALVAVGFGGVTRHCFAGASSIPQAVANLIQAAVLGSMVAPSNLRGHSLPNNSFKPKLLRNSA